MQCKKFKHLISLFSLWIRVISNQMQQNLIIKSSYKQNDLKKCLYIEGSFCNSGVMTSSFTKCYISSTLMRIEHIFCFILFFVLFFFAFFALQIFNSFGILHYKQAISFNSGGWSKPLLSITKERNIETFNITGKT